MSKTINTLIALGLGVGIFFAGMYWKPQTPPLGSVTYGNEYGATTTPPRPSGGSWTDRLIKNGQGQLGSVVITAAGTVKFILYDATSTGSLTTGNFDYRTRILAQVEASQAAGTYIYDTSFSRGLLMDVQTTGTGTSTITYR